MKKLLAVVLAVITCFAASLTFACGTNPKQDVSVKYFASAEEMLPMLKMGNLKIGLLPEPAATKLTQMASDKTWTRLDVQELYDGAAKSYPQAVMLIKESLLSAHPEIVTQMASAFDGNMTWVKENVADAVSAINGALVAGVTPSLNASNISATVVDNCKIYWQGAADAVQSVKKYINDIIAIESTSARTIEDDFFYTSVSGKTFDGNTVKVVAPDGAPALALAKFISDGEDFGTGKTFDYKVVSASTIGAQVSQGVGDIVIIPVNAASKLYKANANNPYKMVSVVTHGNLYIMSSEEITINTLNGKTMGVIGQGLVPDLTLKAVFSKKNITATPAA